MERWKSYWLLTVETDGGTSGLEELCDQVQRWMGAGWQPLGGPVVSLVGVDTEQFSGQAIQGMVCVQAMVHADANAAPPEPTA